MSGGSMNYAYCTIEKQARYLGDRELIDIAKDFAKLFHDAEWWHSSDIDEKGYRETAKWFKDKWLRSDKVDERLRGYIDQIFDDAKQECKLLVGRESNREATAPQNVGSIRPAAFMIRGKLFDNDDSFKWLSEAVKEKMERERNAQMPI
ncbi:MAG: hypothetical protein PHX74_08210 [Candidatus Sumerlaeales bacterium]|nr:hypothetical protein [Candidatus Sumerlaeales bacterium]